MNVFKRGGVLLLLLFVMGTSKAGEPLSSNVADNATEALAVSAEEAPMWMIINGHHFAIHLNDTPAARAFVEELPLTLAMADLNRNEKHAQLPQRLPTDAVRPGVIHSGDLMLYGADTLVVFYLTFNTSYSYTPLGQVTDTTGLVDALGEDDVSITFSMQQHHD